MRIAVAGSIATDHLMVFPGSFTDQLIADRLDKVSLSFLVDDLEVRRGGVAANIAYGLGGLGLRPLLVGAVGSDFAEYRRHLEAHGVDTSGVLVSADRRTARFMAITDRALNQIAAFHSGAMAEAREIGIGAVLERAGDVGLVLVSPDDPAAMLRHTAECRARRVPFAADPSQQLATLDGTRARALVEGARWLFTNEYEAELLRERTGWTESEVLERAGAWVTTLGAEGVRIARSGRPVLTVPAVPTTAPADPTGVGDAFRAGFLAAAGRGLTDRDAARLGCALATRALEAVGPQEYEVSPGALSAAVGRTYGTGAAAVFAPWLGSPAAV
ncbi:carbohydrate kinase family protein [Streptomyces sp. NPDC097619]|uniref:carbohydrate kinase family protein n=1 Tax=Streptomyces sp. NPDC097619 TaxID=3157228 RepID=UPI00331AD65C